MTRVEKHHAITQGRFQMTIKEVLEHDAKFRYMLLSRMKMDMEYYFGYGNRGTNQMWSGTAELQIEHMREIWNSFADKPEWLTIEQIDDYETRLVEVSDGQQ